MYKSCIRFLFRVINYYKSTGLKKHLFFFNLTISIGQRSGHSELNRVSCSGRHKTGIKCQLVLWSHWHLGSFSKLMWLLVEFSSLLL